MTRHRRGIVPPFLLERVVLRGTEAQREWALSTLALDQSFRRARVLAAGGPARGAVGALAVPGQPTPRTVYDAGGGVELPGRPVRREGDPPTGDPAADEAWDGMGATDDLLREVYGRHSLDDEGLPLEAVVHYGERYGNAFWDGRRIVCGDGDGDLFLRFTRSLTVLGHELGHGVVDDEAGFEYQDQPGALGESCSDVIGSLVKQHSLGQKAEEADWLVGAEILGPQVDGRALRSLAAPGTAYDDDVLGRDPQPAHVDDYVSTMADNGGVHINSGIPNHAFYAVAVELGGFAWERAGRIWYEAQQDPGVRRRTQFAGFAHATARAAGRLYGAGSEELRAVRQGWQKVGITAEPGSR